MLSLYWTTVFFIQFRTYLRGIVVVCQIKEFNGYVLLYDLKNVTLLLFYFYHSKWITALSISNYCIDK